MAEPLKKKPATHAQETGGAVDAPATSAANLQEKLKKRMKIRVTKK
jgi:hypothetical protein